MATTRVSAIVGFLALTQGAIATLWRPVAYRLPPNRRVRVEQSMTDTILLPRSAALMRAPH
jgi:hypothetical protein